jgi:hypothetical protein
VNIVFLHAKYLDIERQFRVRCESHQGRERQVVQMLWSDKAFEIYMGHAGEDIALPEYAALVDGMADERTLLTSNACTDASVAPKAGWISRTISAIADRTPLPRIARG